MPKDHEINFKITAETNTAETNAQKLANALNMMQDNASRAVNRLTDMEKSLASSNDRLTETAVTLGGNDEMLDSFGVRMDGIMRSLAGLSEGYKKTAQDADLLAQALTKSADTEASRSQAESLKSAYDELLTKMRALFAEARTLTGEMDSARAAMQEGALTPAQAQTVAALNAEMKKAVTLLRQMKESGSSVIIDADGGMHGVHDLTLTLQKAKEAKDALLEGGDTSAWLEKHGNDNADAVNKIIESYEKLKKAEDKRAEQEAKAAARAEATAEKKLERLDEQAAREAASIEELTAKEKELAEAREKAKAEGNVVEEAKYAEALKKTTAEIEKKTRAQERAATAAEREASAQQKAQEKAAEAARKAGDTATQSIASLIRAAATGTLTVRGLATSIRGLGAAIKAGLGPIGWAVLAIEGLIFAAQTAWGWVKKLWEDNTRTAEESARKQQQILDDAIAAAEKAREKYQAFVDEQQEKAALDQMGASLRQIQKDLDAKVAAQREALSLAMQEAALTQQQEELDRRLALAQLAAEKAGGDMSNADFEKRRQEIEARFRLSRQENELADKRRQYDAGVAENTDRSVAIQRKGADLNILANLDIRNDEQRDQDNAAIKEISGLIQKLLKENKSGNSFGSKEEVAKVLETWKKKLSISQEGTLYFAIAENAVNIYSSLLDEINKLEKSKADKEAATEKEIKELADFGYSELAETLKNQTAKGAPSTIMADIEKTMGGVSKALKDEQAEYDKLEKENAKLSAEISALRERQKTENQIAGYNDATALQQAYERDDEAKRRAEEQRQREIDRQRKEEARREQQRLAQQVAEQRRTEDANFTYQQATQNYEGIGKKALAIFADGKLTANETGTARKLVELAQQNQELKGILETLLSVAEQNAEQSSREHQTLQDLRLDLGKIKNRVNRLASKPR